MHLWPTMRIRDSFKSACLKKLGWNLHIMNNEKKQRSQEARDSNQRRLLDDERFSCSSLAAIVVSVVEYGSYTSLGDANYLKFKLSLEPESKEDELKKEEPTKQEEIEKREKITTDVKEDPHKTFKARPMKSILRYFLVWKGGELAKPLAFACGFQVVGGLFSVFCMFVGRIEGAIGFHGEDFSR
ncbi:hypothetical protein DKX38_027504 [Salix brachista]|uniref:Uncharacterized protein n=1 Tax=Salix brachista TaxID=2182728 RepID=A0A5N5JDW1_9ROSI|nr:hypothetical protein DKX38_027504 [Salix brachista]